MEKLLPKICANDECGNLFTPKVHNAIYCSAECRKIVTNQNVLDRYYEKKELRSNKKRVCKMPDCKTILSIYNKEVICEPHQTENLIQRMIGWGYDEDELREDWSY